METGSVEWVLRQLPGVLDCSVHDEGIAIVVHPEIDPHLMELRAQMALGEIGERRPLLVVGGMSTGFSEPPPVAPRRAMRRRGERSPVSLLGFAVLVVALITVVPIAGGNGKAPRLPSVAAPSFDLPSFDGVPVVDEPAAVVAAVVPLAGPVVPAARAVAKVVTHRATAEAAAVVAAPQSASLAGLAPPGSVAVAQAKPARGEGEAKGKAKAKAKAVGKDRVKAVKAHAPRGRTARR